MTVQTALALALVIGFAAAQYTFMYQALRDLIRRPRVRGGNKVAWGLLILCVPVIGALVYGWMGPTSLIRRPRPRQDDPVEQRIPSYPFRTPSLPNITPISKARSRHESPPKSEESEKASSGRFPHTGS